MNTKQIAYMNSGSKIAKVVAESEVGYDVETESGSTIRGVQSPQIPSWGIGSWVTILRTGVNWQIIGRAVNAPAPEVP